MTRKHHLENLSASLEHAWDHYFTHPETPAAPPAAFTIALGREAGIDAGAVAHEVGRRLGWPVFDHELLERIAEEMHLRPDLLREVDERPVPWLMERLETFMTTKRAATEPAYVEHLISVLLSLSAHGHCVVVGRGSNHFLPPAHTLRVRLIAPREERIAALVRAEGLSREEATRRVATLDRERAEFTHRHFRADPTDPSHYDLLLNCARFGVSESADLIIEALHRLEVPVRPSELVGTRD
jgi:cytidylate kinase